MLEKYRKLNDDSKTNILIELDNLTNDNKTINRCKKEIDLLYDKGILFILEFLYKYKKIDKSVSFNFRGMANNLLILYVLGLSNVSPIKYNLPYELFTDKSLSIDLINGCLLDLIDVADKYATDFRIVKGSFELTNVDEINKISEKHYILIPKYVKPNNTTFKLNEYSQLETVEDYHLLTGKYLTIILDEKKLIQEKKVNVKYALHTKFEEKLANLLKPKTMDDYVKIISLSHGSGLWKENQEKLFKEGKINIHSVISNREDIYEYLIKHLIKHNTAIDIVKQMSKVRNNKLWKKYVNIMKEHDCNELFINILSSSLYVSGRGQAIAECLYAIDEKNYYEL